jgi:hypothetical protein
LGKGKGHLGILQDPVLYLQQNGAAFVIPAAAPPDYPINPPAATPAREAARAANLAKRKAWNTYLIVATITRDQFAAAINNGYYVALDDPTEGLNAISLCDLITHVRTTYTTISQPETNDKMTNFHTGINSTLPLAVDTHKQENVKRLCSMPAFLSMKPRWSPPAQRRPSTAEEWNLHGARGSVVPSSIKRGTTGKYTGLRLSQNRTISIACHQTREHSQNRW